MQLDTKTVIEVIAALWAVVLALAGAYGKVQGDRLGRERELTDHALEGLRDVLAPMAETLAQVARALEVQGAILKEVAEYVAEQRWRDKMRTEGQLPDNRRGPGPPP